MADFTIKQHDRLPSIEAQLTEIDGSPLSAGLAGATVAFIMKPQQGGTVKVNAPAVIEDQAACLVRYDWATGDTDTVGDYNAEWQVTFADGRKRTFPTDTYNTVRVVADLDGA